MVFRQGSTVIWQEEALNEDKIIYHFKMASDKSNEISGRNIKAKSIFVRSLASRNDRCICLMGAV